MYSLASDKFKAALRYSRTVTTIAQLYRQGRLISEGLPVLGGRLTDDAEALIRRRIDLELPGIPEILNLLPSTAPEDGGLWPLGNEIHLFMGIDYEDGTAPEYVPGGVYRIGKPVIKDTGNDLKITLQGWDRGRSVQRAKFITPYGIRVGTNYVKAISDLVKSRLPWLTDDQLKFEETDYTTPCLVFTNEDDPWQMAVKMAASLGCQLVWDLEGALRCTPEPDPSVTPPVFEYHEGQNATITGITRDLDDDEAYNGVIVSGESTSNARPVRAEAWDIDPTSPTYYDPRNAAASVYGAVPKFVTSEYITNTAQAQQAANAELRREMGIVERIDFEALVNPLHESNDVISVRRDRIGVNNVYVLQSFQLGLGDKGTMSGITRKRRVTAHDQHDEHAI